MNKQIKFKLSKITKEEDKMKKKLDLKLVNVFCGLIEYFIDNEDIYKKVLIDESAKCYENVTGHSDAIKEFKKSVKRFHEYGNSSEDSLIETLSYWKAKSYKRDIIKSNKTNLTRRKNHE